MPKSNANQKTLTIKVSNKKYEEMKELCEFFAEHSLSGSFQMYELKEAIFENGLRWAQKRKKGLEGRTKS